MSASRSRTCCAGLRPRWVLLILAKKAKCYDKVSFQSFTKKTKLYSYHHPPRYKKHEVTTKNITFYTSMHTVDNNRQCVTD